MIVLKCELCGNIVELIKDSGVPVNCCGHSMTELIPGTSDGSLEKHVPVVTFNGRNVHVKVGEEAHPMLENHYIEWIAVETTCGIHRTHLEPGQDPEAIFALRDCEKCVAAYAYCNLHGLWKSK